MEIDEKWVSETLNRDGLLESVLSASLMGQWPNKSYMESLSGSGLVEGVRADTMR